MSIQRYHRIHPVVVVLVASDAHGTEDAAEAVCADPLHQAWLLLVPMNEAMRGSVVLCLAYALRMRSVGICMRFFSVLCLRAE